MEDGGKDDTSPHNMLIQFVCVRTIHWSMRYKNNPCHVGSIALGRDQILKKTVKFGMSAKRTKILFRAIGTGENLDYNCLV